MWVRLSWQPSAVEWPTRGEREPWGAHPCRETPLPPRLNESIGHRQMPSFRRKHLMKRVFKLAALAVVVCGISISQARAGCDACSSCCDDCAKPGLLQRLFAKKACCESACDSCKPVKCCEVKCEPCCKPKPVC